MALWNYIIVEYFRGQEHSIPLFLVWMLLYLLFHATSNYTHLILILIVRSEEFSVLKHKFNLDAFRLI